MVVNGYLRISEGRVARTVEASVDVDVDVDEDGRVLGIETYGRAPDFSAVVDVLSVVRVPKHLKPRE